MESVDTLDLKSNRANNPVPVQVWPGADFNSRKMREFFNARLSPRSPSLCSGYKFTRLVSLVGSFCKFWPGAYLNSRASGSFLIFILCYKQFIFRQFFSLSFFYIGGDIFIFIRGVHGRHTFKL